MNSQEDRCRLITLPPGKSGNVPYNTARGANTSFAAPFARLVSLRLGRQALNYNIREDNSLQLTAAAMQLYLLARLGNF